MRLEELTVGAAVRGLIPDELAVVVSTPWFGSEALELTYKSPASVVDPLPQRITAVHEAMLPRQPSAAFKRMLYRFMDDGSHRPPYLRQPFQREPDFDVASVNYSFGELLTRAEHPLVSEIGARETQHG
jgi:hypothetical protein